MEKCATCRFWDGGDFREGLCLRFPPIQHSGVPALRLASHPTTGRFDECGEHQPNVGVTAAPTKLPRFLDEGMSVVILCDGVAVSLNSNGWWQTKTSYGTYHSSRCPSVHPYDVNPKQIKVTIWGPANITT